MFGNIKKYTFTSILCAVFLCFVAVQSSPCCILLSTLVAGMRDSRKVFHLNVVHDAGQWKKTTQNRRKNRLTAKIKEGDSPQCGS